MSWSIIAQAPASEIVEKVKQEFEKIRQYADEKHKRIYDDVEKSTEVTAHNCDNPDMIVNVSSYGHVSPDGSGTAYFSIGASQPVKE